MISLTNQVASYPDPVFVINQLHCGADLIKTLSGYEATNQVYETDLLVSPCKMASLYRTSILECDTMTSFIIYG